MKKYLLQTALFLTAFFLTFLSGYSQAPSKSQPEPWAFRRTFIENKGQFDRKGKAPCNDILYAIDLGSMDVFFTRTGIAYRIDSLYKNPTRKKGDSTKPKRLWKTQLIEMKWENANPNVQVVASGVTNDYHNYGMLKPDRSKVYSIDNVKAYTKLTYKNLYPGVDLEYTYHPVSGFKYSLILHRGADLTKIKMKYSDQAKIALNAEKQITIATLKGEIIEHSPVSFYSDNNAQKITSRFVLSNNTVSFELDKANFNRDIVIDPWVQTPALANSNGVWECETDKLGNVYVIGGDMPMKLLKYGPAGGAPIWTYSTPWDTANNWLGTLATDSVGNSFITSGSSAAIQQINSGGGLVWNANGGAMDEYWIVTFNCDQTKLVVGGTRLNPIFIDQSHGVIFDINKSNGSVLNYLNVAGVRPNFIISEANEVRALSSSKNSRYYYLTLDTIGAINQNMTLCPTGSTIFAKSSTYEFAYKSENFRPNNGNSGIMAIRGNDQFVYTQNGTSVHKRDMTTGAIITTAAIPGGSNTTMLGFNQPGNCGVALDNCGNVYIGSADRVIKYDANLNVLQSSAILPFAVYDVAIGTAGNVIVCGATGNSSSTSRTGYVQSISMTACTPFTLVCCNASMCPAGPFCASDPAFQLVVEQAGGTFSGPGVSPTGLFTPATAGVGTHILTYTLPCGSSSITVVVNSCATLNVCQSAGSIFVSGGSGPYQWQNFTVTQNCSGCAIQALCLPPGCETNDTTWTTFASGASITIPGTFPIRVIDNGGSTLFISGVGSIPPCTACTTSVNSPTICSGQTATLTATGATNYSWSNGGVTSSIQVSPTVTTTYTVTGTTGACTDTETCVVTVTASPTVTVTPNPVTICSGETVTLTASGATTYTWTPGTGLSGTTGAVVNANPVTSITYTVSGTTSGCTGTTTVPVTVTSAIVANAGNDTTICQGTSANLIATGGSSYAWSPATGLSCTNCQNPIATPTVTTTYTVTVSSGSCTPATDVVVVTVGSSPAITITPNPVTICPGSSETLVASGATNFTWSPSTGLNTTTGNTVIANPAVTTTYTVTGTTGSCTGTTTVVVTVSSVLAISVNSPVICAGGSATLTASGGTTYAWNTGATTNPIIVSPATTTTYSVTGTTSGCSGSSTCVVTVNQIPVPTITGDTLVCSGSTTILTATGGTTYLWSTSATTASITVNPLTVTTYTVTVSNGPCYATEDITVSTLPNPTANAGNDTTITLGASAQLSGSGGVTYAWSPATGLSCTDCANPVATPSVTTTYTLVVTGANGCTHADIVIVSVEIQCGEVFIPNAFSPNNDGQNDLECVFGNCITEIRFAIFDRWGEKVFETTDPVICWDGKYKGEFMNSGVFVYYMKATLLTGEEIERQGNITLFR
ncbi:MAG: gliding motility-associated C-terminal domain-containing protein [Bacteroidota bacterium]